MTSQVQASPVATDCGSEVPTDPGTRLVSPLLPLPCESLSLPVVVCFICLENLYVQADVWLQ